MKKTIIKIIYIVAVYIISLIVISKVTDKQSSDMTARMPGATLPTVSFIENGQDIGVMHGYTSEMNVSYMHPDIFPIGQDRSVRIRVNLYEQTIDNLRFEVRTSDASSLVESTPITAITNDASGNAQIADFQIKDLIEQNKEYALVVLADVKGRTVRYYSRIVWTGDSDRYHLDEKLAFVKEFSDMTFGSDDTRDELRRYLESSSAGDNSSYAHVDIHSSVDQVMWGDMDVRRMSKPQVSTLDLHEQTGSFLLSYQAEIGGSRSYLCNVEEYFRIRYTADRIYLLDYDRTADNIFQGQKDEFPGAVIDLGIARSSEVSFAESDNGQAIAFISQDRLYAYNIDSNKLSYIFGFYDADNDDIRCRLQKNDIHILSIDDAGDVNFAVAGYMNRGNYEGRVGICIYTFNATTNTVEEQAFIPSDQSEDIVRSYADKILVMGGSRIYVMLGRNLYLVDLNGRTSSQVIEGMIGCEYEISDSGELLAWQDTGDEKGLESINVMNFSSQIVNTIKAEQGEYIRLLGYMDNDLVYGLVRKEDIHNDPMGNPVLAMYTIKIQDTTGKILENYDAGSYFITDTQITDNQIFLVRKTWNGASGLYEDAPADQIMSTLKTEEVSNQLITGDSEEYKNLTQISLKSQVSADSLKLLTPSQTLYEGSREVETGYDTEETGDEEAPIFYVYYRGGISEMTPDSSIALATAFAEKSVIVDNTGSYIWYSGNLMERNQIMSITNAVEDKDYTGQDSLEVCLERMLELEGINVDAGALLSGGATPEQILSTSIPGAIALDYDGCDMTAMQYYLTRDIPVLARLTDGSALLLIGYNTQNIVLFDPSKGTQSVYKNGINDSQALFEQNGNHFTTYIPSGK